MPNEFLEFEKPVAELEAKINELQHLGRGNNVNISKEISQLEIKKQKLISSIFSTLTPWQVVQLARHPERPHSTDYIERIFTDFDELHGDRHSKDCQAIIAGTARINGKSVMVIAQEKGREVDEKVKHNFGMPRPEGYRKALRLMQLAEKFNLPIITIIDTPGAYPGVDAENHNQSEAIARNISVMSSLKVPIVSIVIGEGMSGGALAIGVCDVCLMLEYSIYSVISPEGCASILWKSADYTKNAAEIMQLTAADLLKHKLIDEIIPEPLGGCHRDFDDIAIRAKTLITNKLAYLSGLSVKDLLDKRYEKLMLNNID